ncbi:TPA: phosphopantothenoylcysteine decarboxylase, partial [Staphylococcus aureus]
MKNVLIVAGGCLEKWDDVRGHTNLSTGRVGVYLADALSKYNFNMYYLSGYMSKKPNNESNICEFVQFWGIEDLRDKAKMLILEKKIDIVIMAAAGSDWILDYIKDKKTDEVLEGTGKISSDIEPIVYLKKAPKILKLFKEWKPSLCVVGFKLESGNLVEKA